MRPWIGFSRLLRWLHHLRHAGQLLIRSYHKTPANSFDSIVDDPPIQTQAVSLQPVVINPVLASKFALSLLQ
jgi:hypothetical protein